ncbi:MAG: hypothetical protein NDI61_01955 [Bdellovibrionaceae bacterium]|nr:hypothetical protein [Pseudobdellovibrionaceae bacterium]
MDMTNAKSCAPLLNGFGLLILFMLLTAALPLSALAQPDSFSIEQRARFYLRLMPQQQQAENTMDPSDYGVFQQSCFQTGYGAWARSMKSSEELAQRYSYLIGKLNRPFFYQYVPRNDSKLHVIGSLDDFREMICVGLVLNDGKAGDEATAGASSDFIKAVLRLPNINSQVLDLMLSLWDKSDRDFETGHTIVTHPLFNQFNLRDLIGSLFKMPMPVAARISILQTILKSDHYSKYSAELFPLLLSESSNFINAEERFMIARILVKEKKHEHTSLLNFATFKVDSSKDYTDLFQQFSNGQTIDGQFKVISTLLYAGANIPNAESIFLEIWKQSTSRELKDSMTTFAQNDLSKSRWLSRDTVHRVTLERLSEPVSAKTINMTLSFYRRGEESSPEIKLNVLRRLDQQQTSFDASSAENFIDTATELRAANPAVENEISGSVSALGTRFRENDRVLTAYVRYLKNMNDKKSEMALVQKLLPETRIEERDLLSIAHDTYDLNNEASYSFLELLLTQTQITARGLSELVDIVGPTRVVNFKPDLSAGARRILTLILGHSKATAKVREDVNRYLNPTLKYIVDPISNKHR